MKYIITTVGTSAIEKAKDQIHNFSVKNYEDKNYDYLNAFAGDLKTKKRELFNYFSEFDVNNDNHLKQLPAEIKSLKKLNCNNNTFNYLILTDTAECRLCGEFLSEYIVNKFNSKSKQILIKGLQVDDLNSFQKEGMHNLVNELYNIHYSYPKKDTIINITGGYKATIPYLTILGQTWGIPLYYIFEETNNLLKIPSIKINIDFQLFQKYFNQLTSLKNEPTDDWENFKTQFDPNDLREIEEIYIYKLGNEAELSSIGKILWWEYGEGCQIPKSTKQSQDKTKDISQEPQRTQRFERFKDALSKCRYVDEFHYLKGCNENMKKAEIVGDEIHTYYEQIVLSVKPTSSHPEHLKTIQKAIENLMS